jgi:hypothetical protein
MAARCPAALHRTVHATHPKQELLALIERAFATHIYLK